MTQEERAVQIWPVLMLCALRRMTITYGELARLTGMHVKGLGGCLHPIQAYCSINRLPLLNVLVIDATTGLPGDGYLGNTDVPRQQAKVYAFGDWVDVHCPTAGVLESAVRTFEIWTQENSSVKSASASQR